MSFKIAISGKGGVGKTTVAGLIVTRLIAHKRIPVLAVDADPNTCLDAVLGVKAASTVGRVREETREVAGKGLASGISKQQLLQLKISESLVEADNFDLIAMGRPEGPGCYCYANNVLKEALTMISAQYPYMVLDNEAGLENLSRRIVQRVDVLAIVADPSARGLETAKRLHELAREMDVRYSRLALVINRLRRSDLPAGLSQLQKTIGADVLLALPDDDELARFAEENKAVFSLPQTNPLLIKIDGFLKNLRLI